MTNQEVIKTCINKELALYDTTMEAVKSLTDSGFFNEEIPWYQYYTFNSEQEFNEWKGFCINLFSKELKMSKKEAEKEFSLFNLSYGLKQNYDVI